MAYITITPQELAESAHKFRRELLTIPAKRVAELANYMTPRPGVTYKETVGSLSGAVELAPYDPMNVDKSGFTQGNAEELAGLLKQKLGSRYYTTINK